MDGWTKVTAGDFHQIIRCLDKNVTRRTVQKTLTGTGTSTRAHKLEKINNLFTFFFNRE